jgi:metal-sensitive transcriptional repressor
MPGYAGDKDQVLTRLRRIEGQVRGLQRLVDQDTYCIDVLIQISAVDKALKGRGRHPAGRAPAQLRPGRHGGRRPRRRGDRDRGHRRHRPAGAGLTTGRVSDLP